MEKILIALRRMVLAATFAVAAGCASVAQTPTALQAAPAGQPVLVVAQPVTLSLDTGFHRTVAAGSRWQLAGHIAQGDVYQAVGDVFTVEGAHIHEAYMVVDKQTVLGFYLPAERGFSSLKQRSAITFQ